MKIHEYQAKQLFIQYGIETQPQQVVHTVDEAKKAAEEMGFPVVIKAQVLVGGRGKAGGVRLAKNVDEARSVAHDILDLTIKGLPVRTLLVAPAATIHAEYYVGITLDRNAKKMTLMISREGGVDIEELAVTNHDAIARMHINPLNPLDESELTAFLKPIFDSPHHRHQASNTILKLDRLIRDNHCSLVEINPYAVVDGGNLIALDAKINFDDNALFRLPEIEALKNPEEHSADETDATEHGLSFVSMDGNIGCIVNGAGLAMATMDLIKLFGGEPANFLDVGGSSNPEKVLHALRIITNNPKVQAILVNIFGGITRCDDIANGIVMALQQIDIRIPMVVRLIGTNEREGRKILHNAGFEVAEELSTAVKKVIASVNDG